MARKTDCPLRVRGPFYSTPEEAERVSEALLLELVLKKPSVPSHALEVDEEDLPTVILPS